ncbi:MAG: amidohydrolase family protein [Shimia sp.]|uniref:amidohydrolase family protein n=1 Tax=Shimia sp. TaxID=1954381 RepID=UPI0040583269
MIIDAHQHFWTLSRGDYPWPNDSVAAIFRDFGPEDLAPLLAATGVDNTILVQATDTVAETTFLLDVAANAEWVAGVVGWVDFSAADAIDQIEVLRKDPTLKELRPMLQNIADTNWILSASFTPVLAHMEAVGLCFDALIQPRHLVAIQEIAARHPVLKIVVDHIAKPAMGGGQGPSQAWQNGMAALARSANVHCKLSGVDTEIGAQWEPADIAPFVDNVLDSFGAQKVIFGSDWPVVNLASSYATWHETVQERLSQMSAADRAGIMGANAIKFYGLKP